MAKPAKKLEISDEVAIQITKMNKWYGQFQVLAECTTTVREGEVVVVCGPSGSGKSTLIKCVNGLEPFQQGDIIVNGISIADPKTNLSRLRAHVGMVFRTSNCSRTCASPRTSPSVRSRC